MRLLALLLLPLLMGGCITAMTVGSATCEQTRYLHDEVKHVEKAAVTPDSRLVLWVDGKMAGAEQPGKYMVTGSLVAGPDRRKSVPWEVGHANIPRTAIVAGWDGELMSAAELLPVSVAPPVILPGHEAASSQIDRLTGLRGTERSVYVLENSAHDFNLELVYVEADRVPRKILFHLEAKNLQVPHRYYLLLWLPVTIPADAATLPFQLLLLPLVLTNKC